VRPRLVTDASGKCPECKQQPCVCAYAKDRFWVDRLEVEADLQNIEDCCDKFLVKYVTRHNGNPVVSAAYKAVWEMSETMALARASIRGEH